MAPFPPIDLNKVPSAMEERAAAWSTIKTPPAPPPVRKPAAAPRPPRPQIKPEPQRDRRRAERDAWIALVADHPTPEEVAAYLGEWGSEGMRTAWRGRNGWRVRPEYVLKFRELGLVEVGGNWREDMDPNIATHNHLTAFGIAVRRVVVEQSA